MPSGWDVYYLVFLSAVAALGVPAVLRLISLLFSGRKVVPRSAAAPDESETQLGRRLNTRFFLGANTALLLIAFGLILIPCVGTIRGAKSHSDVIGGMIVILSLSGLAWLALIYSARKGDLNWLKSFLGGGRE